MRPILHPILGAKSNMKNGIRITRRWSNPAVCYSDAMEDIFDSVALRAAGISAGHPLAHVIAGRAEIIELTERSHDAALKPDPAGGLSHTERAALACRMARLNLDDGLASHYESLVDEEGASIADPAFDGAGDARLRAIIRHTDLVTRNPKDATAGDVSALKAAGIREEDIVRLPELIAFVNYQIRVVGGLRLMAAAADGGES